MVENSYSFETYNDDDIEHHHHHHHKAISTTASSTTMTTSSGNTTTNTTTTTTTKDIVYLNNAGQAKFTPEVEHAGIQAISTPPWGPHGGANDAIQIRQSFATLIDCSDLSDIAIVPNTAYAISLAASNIQRTIIDSGKKRTTGKIVLMQDQYDSAVYPWQQICDTSNGRITLDIVPYPNPGNDDDNNDNDGGWTPGILKRLDETVIAACIPPLHWSDGSLIDLEAISAKCRLHDITLIVDATQAVGIMPVSVTKIQPTMLASSVHKWLRSPAGTSMIYVSKEVQSSWNPLSWHGRSRQITADKAWNANQNEMSPKGYPEEFFNDARKFNQGGKPNPILLPMLRTSLEQVVQTMTMTDGTLNFQSAQDQLKQVMEPLLEWATANGYEQTPGPHASHIIGLRPTSTNYKTPHQLLDIATRLQQEGIYLAVRCGGFRISPYLDTTPEDIQRLIDALERVTKSPSS